MQLVDTHTHLYDPDFAGKMLLVSTFLERNTAVYDDDSSCATQILDAAQQHANAYAALGIYPEFAAGLDLDASLVQLRALIQQNRAKVVAIGETGLDYHRQPTDAECTAQQELFRAQLELASEFQLPVILHIRDANRQDAADAFCDAFAVLDDFPEQRAVCHSFTGRRADLEQALARGYYISINGIYTFNKDPELQATLNAIPLTRLLLETDAPYLSPAPHRKERNRSSFLPAIATAYAAAHNLTTAEVAAATSQNADDLFGI